MRFSIYVPIQNINYSCNFQLLFLFANFSIYLLPPLVYKYTYFVHNLWISYPCCILFLFEFNMLITMLSRVYLIYSCEHASSFWFSIRTLIHKKIYMVSILYCFWSNCLILLYNLLFRSIIKYLRVLQPSLPCEPAYCVVRVHLNSRFTLFVVYLTLRLLEVFTLNLISICKSK